MFARHYLAGCRPAVMMALLAAGWGTVQAAEDLSGLVADRAAVERVYFSHRLGQHETFEQALPRATLATLVKLDQDKEAVLKEVYGVTVTAAMVATEVHRIDATSRAPAMLAELKSALKNDPVRFGQTVARPMIVERILRERFENDDALHAAQRSEVEKARLDLLAAKKSGAGTNQLLNLLVHGYSNEVMESTWRLTPRPAARATVNPSIAEIRKQFGTNAQIMSVPEGAENNDRYIEDLPDDLRHVLLIQLRQAGDVSAVIEAGGGFLLYLARNRTPETLDVACLTVGKRDFDGWFREQCAKLKQ